MLVFEVMSFMGNPLGKMSFNRLMYYLRTILEYEIAIKIGKMFILEDKELYTKLKTMCLDV